MENLDDLVAELELAFPRKTTADWLGLMEKAGVPAGPILDITQTHDDPQARARDLVVELAHPVAGKTHTLGLPVKFSDTPGQVQSPAPVLGQHSREVLEEHGYTPDAVTHLIQSGAVVSSDQG